MMYNSELTTSRRHVVAPDQTRVALKNEGVLVSVVGVIMFVSITETLQITSKHGSIGKKGHIR